MNYKKLDKRINDMLQYESDNFLVDIDLDDNVSNNLLDYQYLHVFNLITALRYNKIILDGSDTGTGKTYCAIATCKQLKLQPFIICPKTIISNWKKVCDYFQVKPITIVNYETIKNGKIYDDQRSRIISNYFSLDDQFNNDRRFVWKLPKNSIVIFDEVHKCKNKNSINAKLLLSLKKFNIQAILLSATISDTPDSFHVFGYMLDLYKNIRQGRNWINSMLREDRNYIGKKPKISSINSRLYPFKGSRMQISDIGDKFPKNQVIAELYDIEDSETSKVNNIFENISLSNLKLTNKITSNNDKGKILVEIMKMRQNLELIKLPIIEDLIKEYIDNNYGVVVFLNFNKSIDILSNKFKTKCIINGNFTDEIRNKNIESFQLNESNLILCNIKAGGQSINLHDLYGKPRVSLISPSFSSLELLQALGRINRAGAKSPALQRIIYCANTCENIICDKIGHKLKFLSKINDDDMTIGQNFINKFIPITTKL